MDQINEQVKEIPSSYTGGRLVHHGQKTQILFLKNQIFL
jgi:hypothetical protein